MDEDTAAVAVVSTAKKVIDVDDRHSLEELIFSTSSAALEAAGWTVDDIDDVVLSGNDEIDGRVISVMPSAGPAGGVGRDTTMIASIADQALVYSYLRLKAGQCRRLLVVGWAKPSESVDADRVELMAAEPYLLRGIGMNQTIAAALQASTWGVRPADEAEVLVWPLTRDGLPRRGDSVYAAVLAIEGAFESGTEDAWVVDAGWTTMSYELGSRDLSRLESLELAVKQIELRNPAAGPSTWSFVEVGADSQPAVDRVVQTLALRDGVAVNSIGSLSEIPTSPHVAGLGRMIAAINDLKGDSSGELRYSAGIGFHGFASQGATVMVFASQKKGVTA